MRRLKLFSRAALLMVAIVLPSSGDDRWIVRVHPSVVESVARQYNLKVDKQLKAEGVFLVSLPRTSQAGALVDLLRADSRVRHVENNADIRLPELSTSDNSGHRVPVLRDGPALITMSGAPWVAYLNQPANLVVRIPDAHRQFGQGSGAVAVAIIDTGIDYNHPVLAPVLNTWDGHNFINGSSDASVKQETTPFVDQETTPFVDGSGAVVLNQETTPFVDQETTPFVDGAKKVPPAYGHGTMVAGLIHLVAPNVRIIPLKAFGGDGWGTIAGVIEAIEWAVARRAQVINMSFSAPVPSAELSQAIADASAAGLICVASVANNGADAVVYPSNIEPVIGVAATTDDDYRAQFSNYGADVDVGAPGVGVISTYPQNRYAAGWGTSFSTAYVSGTAALMRGLSASETASSATTNLSRAGARVSDPQLDWRRLDVFRSLAFASHEK